MKIIFDTETTGLDPLTDDILQLSMIDEDGNVLLNTYFSPVRKKSWLDAMAVHGITPQMVSDAPLFDQYRERIQNIFNDADMLIAYNGGFDIAFLEYHGICIPDVPIVDVMQEFAPIYGEWNSYFGDYKWQKLSTCARYYGYEFKAHDSLEDVRATLHCWKKMNE